MFVDKVLVTVQAGNGGNGVVSFRHEKFVDRGGPDGGDGGDGGDVILVASYSQNTLANFRYKKRIEAPAGENGSKSRKHGRSAQDLLVPVPVGTVATTEDGRLLADLTQDGQQVVIAHGGKGGFGNAHFVSSTRQAPRVAEKGEPGERLEVIFELKMIADVGLVGLPNAGKSTFLASVSNARPEIADYPFTTLTPNLGVIDVEGHASLLVADIPGLIEGASEGKGLGIEFLRHIERTSVLLHLIDAYNEDLAGAYKTIQNELAGYSAELVSKPQVVAITKTEGLDAEMIEDRLKELRKTAPKGTVLLAISSHSKDGIRPLLYELVKLVEAERKRQKEAAMEESSQLPRITIDTEQAWHVTQDEEKTFTITGKKIERFAQRTHFNTFAGEQRLRDIMRKMGIMHELERRGIEKGDKIRIGKPLIGVIEY